MYMHICFEGLREDRLSQLSYPHKIKKFLSYLGLGVLNSDVPETLKFMYQS